jgi:hypothetical protein
MRPGDQAVISTKALPDERANRSNNLSNDLI